MQKIGKRLNIQKNATSLMRFLMKTLTICRRHFTFDPINSIYFLTQQQNNKTTVNAKLRLMFCPPINYRKFV